jgi:dehydrogenase/reductase SDR family protein 12
MTLCKPLTNLGRNGNSSAFADRLLDAAVLPGYSRLGFALRGLGHDNAAATDLRGRTALVTGGSSGIGEAACAGLLAAGATVHLLGRDEGRVLDAIARLRSTAGLTAQGRLVPEVCDVSDLGAVCGFAGSFLERFPSLDILVNNAGVLAQRRERTPQGVELTFATNVLGPFLLTRLLMPALRAAAPARVITVSSGGMYTARLDAADPQLDRRQFDGPHFYAHSKRAEVVLSGLWAGRVDPGEVAFHSMHPGWADTGGVRTSLPRFHRLLRPLLRDPAEGADTIVWLAAASSLEPRTGGFWHDRAPRPEHRLPWTRETAADRSRLWTYCERLSVSGPQPVSG